MLSAMAKPGRDLTAVFDQISAIGSQPGAGVTRLAASAEDGAARDAFARWMEGGGARIVHDEVGNQFACFEWAGKNVPWIFAGSHLDTQPRGGRFDGTLGVLAAGSAALDLHEEIRTGQFKPSRNLAVLNWTNEEGARFQPSLTGSSVFSGALPLHEALGLQDGSSISLREALAAIGVDGDGSAVPPRPEAYVELHVEQGRKLIEAGRQIGIVEGTWAARKIAVRWIGRAAHTGPTPMSDRRDALLAAAQGITAFETLIAARHPQLHRSAARIVIEPNSPNVVVERATVWFELRGLDVEELNAAGRAVLAAFELAAANTGTRIELVADTLRAPANMDPRMMKIVDGAARGCDFIPLIMRSVAGHDAVALQNSGIPCALLFVPSADGVAHHPDEFTKQEDVAAGLMVLRAALRDLVQRGYHAG
ncbi:N-carbamoyl-L-amino-acid hydrolase [Aquamicrobium defluvii]|uniref:N-carbamoyl-L-amino-acid hydrolase n=2 Tax=Aquamicrobium defluvii TaxID=69279 RepID=A0A4R6Y072_9HYPH|nr:allantoate amidohydrolase [Halopseudomonas bauzanensis]TDR27827.1 N-carbamoyl-L-amino-acid hydrolase [Aquamicrobium defluvii]